MQEPDRIGLSTEALGYLKEMLESLGDDLNYRDLFRLAVALELKNEAHDVTTSYISDGWKDRTNELDPDKSLYFAVEAFGLCSESQPVYKCIEALGENGIRKLYDAYQKNMGVVPWNKILA
tara:strand:- start:9 stop:371 length:363 start_codon:yes stop_codon:yes gene_type:complete